MPPKPGSADQMVERGLELDVEVRIAADADMECELTAPGRMSRSWRSAARSSALSTKCG